MILWRMKMGLSEKKLIVATLLVVLGCSLAYGQRSMSVTVKEVEVRKSPSFLGAVVAKLSYGDTVRTRREQGSWVEIDIPDSRDTGWVHISALERKRIIFGATDTEVASEATSGEIALAGKGFNKEVEERYIEETNLDFSLIDEMEATVVPFEEIAEFITEGGLKDLGGDEE
jgi:hypothetical protein